MCFFGVCFMLFGPLQRSEAHKRVENFTFGRHPIFNVDHREQSTSTRYDDSIDFSNIWKKRISRRTSNFLLFCFIICYKNNKTCNLKWRDHTHTHSHTWEDQMSDVFLLIDHYWKNEWLRYWRHSSESSFFFAVDISFWIAVTSSPKSKRKTYVAGKH